MYILLDSFANTSLPLQNTLNETGTECNYLVLNDDRFLPLGFISMFDFIIDSVSPLPDSFHDVYLPCVKIPHYYSLLPYNTLYYNIHHLGQKKGLVWFRHDSKELCADRIERLDENGKLVCQDYYNRYGFIAYSDFYDEENEAISRCYYSSDNKPILNYSYRTDSYCLFRSSKTVLTFVGKDALISYCLFLLHLHGESIIPTSYSQITLLKQANILDRQAKFFLFQSAEDYHKYMNEPSLHRESQTILLMNNESTKDYIKTMSEPTHVLRYIGKNNRILPPRQQALTLTRSDQIECLAELAQTNPHITFHVAAYTMVSPTLLSYEKYKNIKIHPSISFQKLQELLSISSFYLDINYYNEAYDSIVSAASTPLLLMGFKDTLHNPDYILPEYIFPEGDHVSFAKALHQLSTDQALYLNHLNRQLEDNRKTFGILKTLLTECETIS
ncbi:MAG: hypothetical protein J6I68_13245 [Butyrivibrio sp.]|uniref:hypothetical protein n=1 Tax=Butyrivibrio sp. TaxID=28121 RepID=UPI001B53603D|nr:hypothetical protein [Butyrivibrio sp.]MBP3784205.1 hypothetical protein [Butyrivibrio sp.]